MQALLEKLSETLNVNEFTVSKRLKEIEMIQKDGNWAPMKFRGGDIAKCLTICEVLQQRQKRKSFLHRIMTGDEKWIRYHNRKRTKSQVRPGKPSTFTPKPDIQGKKAFGGTVGVVYYELLQQGEPTTVT